MSLTKLRNWWRDRIRFQAYTYEALDWLMTAHEQTHLALDRIERTIAMDVAGLKASVDKAVSLIHSLKAGQDERDAKIKDLIDKAAQTNPDDQKAIDDIKSEVDGVLAEFATKTDEATQAASEVSAAADTPAAPAPDQPAPAPVAGDPNAPQG